MILFTNNFDVGFFADFFQGVECNKIGGEGKEAGNGAGEGKATRAGNGADKRSEESGAAGRTAGAEDSEAGGESGALEVVGVGFGDFSGFRGGFGGFVLAFFPDESNEADKDTLEKSN